jgi:small basic protein
MRFAILMAGFISYGIVARDVVYVGGQLGYTLSRKIC